MNRRLFRVVWGDRFGILSDVHSEIQRLMQILRQALGDPFYDDGQVAGFRVPQKHTSAPVTRETFILGDGWYPRTELYDQPVRWMSQTGTLLIDKSESMLTRLSITAFSPMSNFVTVTMTVNDVTIETFQVAPNPETPKIYFIPTFTLTSGSNEVKFKVQPVGQPIRQLDSRVYLGVYDITQQAIP